MKKSSWNPRNSREFNLIKGCYKKTKTKSDLRQSGCESPRAGTSALLWYVHMQPLPYVQVMKGRKCSISALPIGEPIFLTLYELAEAYCYL